jgi:hypothetical protein
MGILETRKNTLRPKKIWRDIEVTWQVEAPYQMSWKFIQPFSGY